jgi:hypothetical protein
MPLADATALNQTVLPARTSVPLKFDVMAVWAGPLP